MHVSELATPQWAATRQPTPSLSRGVQEPTSSAAAAAAAAAASAAAVAARLSESHSSVPPEFSFQGGSRASEGKRRQPYEPHTFSTSLGKSRPSANLSPLGISQRSAKRSLQFSSVRDSGRLNPPDLHGPGQVEATNTSKKRNGKTSKKSKKPKRKSKRRDRVHREQPSAGGQAHKGNSGSRAPSGPKSSHAGRHIPPQPSTAAHEPGGGTQPGRPPLPKQNAARRGGGLRISTSSVKDSTGLPPRSRRSPSSANTALKFMLDDLNEAEEILSDFMDSIAEEDFLGSPVSFLGASVGSATDNGESRDGSATKEPPNQTAKRLQMSPAPASPANLEYLEPRTQQAPSPNGNENGDAVVSTVRDYDTDDHGVPARPTSDAASAATNTGETNGTSSSGTSSSGTSSGGTSSSESNRIEQRGGSDQSSADSETYDDSDDNSVDREMAPHAPSTKVEHAEPQVQESLRPSSSRRRISAPKPATPSPQRSKNFSTNDTVLHTSLSPGSLDGSSRGRHGDRSKPRSRRSSQVANSLPGPLPEAAVVDGSGQSPRPSPALAKRSVDGRRATSRPSLSERNQNPFPWAPTPSTAHSSSSGFASRTHDRRPTRSPNPEKLRLLKRKKRRLPSRSQPEFGHSVTPSTNGLNTVAAVRGVHNNTTASVPDISALAPAPATTINTATSSATPHSGFQHIERPIGSLNSEMLLLCLDGKSWQPHACSWHIVDASTARFTFETATSETQSWRFGPGSTVVEVPFPATGTRAPPLQELRHLHAVHQAHNTRNRQLALFEEGRLDFDAANVDLSRTKTAGQVVCIGLRSSFDQALFACAVSDDAHERWYLQIVEDINFLQSSDDDGDDTAIVDFARQLEQIRPARTLATPPLRESTSLSTAKTAIKSRVSRQESEIDDEPTAELDDASIVLLADTSSDRRPAPKPEQQGTTPPRKRVAAVDDWRSRVVAPAPDTPENRAAHFAAAAAAAAAAEAFETFEHAQHADADIGDVQRQAGLAGEETDPTHAKHEVRIEPVVDDTATPLPVEVEFERTESEALSVRKEGTPLRFKLKHNSAAKHQVRQHSNPAPSSQTKRQDRQRQSSSSHVPHFSRRKTSGVSKKKRTASANPHRPTTSKPQQARSALRVVGQAISLQPAPPDFDPDRFEQHDDGAVAPGRHQHSPPVSKPRRAPPAAAMVKSQPSRGSAGSPPDESTRLSLLKALRSTLSELQTSQKLQNAQNTVQTIANVEQFLERHAAPAGARPPITTPDRAQVNQLAHTTARSHEHRSPSARQQTQSLPVDPQALRSPIPTLFPIKPAANGRIPAVPFPLKVTDDASDEPAPSTSSAVRGAKAMSADSAPSPKSEVLWVERMAKQSAKAGFDGSPQSVRKDLALAQARAGEKMLEEKLKEKKQRLINPTRDQEVHGVAGDRDDEDMYAQLHAQQKFSAWVHDPMPIDQLQRNKTKRATNGNAKPLKKKKSTLKSNMESLRARMQQHAAAKASANATKDVSKDEPSQVAAENAGSSADSRSPAVAGGDDTKSELLPTKLLKLPSPAKLEIVPPKTSISSSATNSGNMASRTSNGAGPSSNNSHDPADNFGKVPRPHPSHDLQQRIAEMQKRKQQKSQNLVTGQDNGMNQVPSTTNNHHHRKSSGVQGLIDGILGHSRHNSFESMASTHSASTDGANTDRPSIAIDRPHTTSADGANAERPAVANDHHRRRSSGIQSLINGVLTNIDLPAHVARGLHTRQDSAESVQTHETVMVTAPDDDDEASLVGITSDTGDFAMNEQIDHFTTDDTHESTLDAEHHRRISSGVLALAQELDQPGEIRQQKDGTPLHRGARGFGQRRGVSDVDSDEETSSLLHDADRGRRPRAQSKFFDGARDLLASSAAAANDAVARLTAPGATTDDDADADADDEGADSSDASPYKMSFLAASTQLLSIAKMKIRARLRKQNSTEDEDDDDDNLPHHIL